MLSRAKLLVALLLVIVLAGALTPATNASGATATLGPSDSRVQLLSSTEAGVTFEVSVPWEKLSLEPVTIEGKGYVRVSLPGWMSTARAGAPALPQLAQTIGVPFGVALSVHVEPGAARTLALDAPLLPAATQKVEWGQPAATEVAPTLPQPVVVVEEDPAIYAGRASYPAMLAEVTSDGMVRQQRVAGIAAYPVQYNPATREITVYESLRVEVSFEGQVTAGSPTAESAAYEQVFRQSLLNYEAAHAWRSSLPSSPSGKEVGGEGAGTEAIPWAPPVPGWRVKVREDGIYKLSYAELLAAGVPVDTGLPTSSFRLFNLGTEVAIDVSDADTDGIFEDGDLLVFYGQSVSSKYARDNVYWLTYGGTGLRMSSRDGTPRNADIPAYYAAQHHMEGYAIYLSGIATSEDLEGWLWAQVVPPSLPSWEYTFPLAEPYAGTYPATLTVSMLGYLQNAIYPDHHVTISLNGTQVADVKWDGKTWNIVEVPIAQTLLKAGNNTLRVEDLNDTGVGYDIVYIDWAELKFANTFAAEKDVRSFSYEAAGTRKFEVTRFSNSALAVYDVTDPAAVVRITGSEVVKSGSTWLARFQDQVTAPTEYVATATTAYRTVQTIEQDTASNLQSTSNGADYIVISHKDFAAQAASLRAWRASQGLRAMSVDVQDVYDEFGYGLVGPAAIHDFLAYAYASWAAPAPSFVVLLGDGSYDPKDYLGQGRITDLPPYLAPVDPWIDETAADNRYVTLVGDDTFPDMMLGRLAVNTSAEATAFVTKIVAYEQSPVTGDWQQKVLAVADNADGAGDFAQMSDDLLACCLPAPYQAEKVYYLVNYSTAEAARAAIVAAINAGKLIVNFIGHGSTTQWADALFRVADVAGLVNGSKAPVMLSMTCYDGYYHNPTPKAGQEALAEVVTSAEGKGAVASWSPTGLGVASGHHYLDKGFFQAVFQNGLLSLGQATTAGKLSLWATGANLDLIDTYLLFGDPAMEIAVPGPAPSADLQVGITVSPAGSVTPGTVLDYTITFANNGPDTATGVVLSDPMPTQLINPVVVSASPGVTLRTGTTFTWDIDPLAAGASGTIVVRGTVDPGLVPPYSIVNTAQIAAAETDPLPGNNTASVTTEVAAPSMHVGDLDGYRSNQNKKFWWASVTALILDNSGNPVTNATVSGAWSDGVTGTSSCVTGSAGTCISTSPSIPLTRASVTFTVTGVSHATLTYDPAQNVVTSIVVYKDAPVNQPPVASFTYSCTGLVCTFDGSASSDPDGTIVSYGWNFGDGGTGSGVTTSHTYGSAGMYTVVLTVTDNAGATGSTSQSVPVDIPPGEMYVYDIAMSGGRAGASRFATAVLMIFDASLGPVEGATVYGTWSGDYSASVQGTTAANGTVTFTSGKVKKANATFTFTVTNILKNGFTYIPALNRETSDTIIVP